MPVCPGPTYLPRAARIPCAHGCSLAAPKARCHRSSTVRVVCGAATAASVRTYYDVLGVRDTASVRDIKDSFRRLALMWHPDRCKQPGAKDKFMELKTAYETLLDLTARSKYDLQLKQAAAPPQSQAGPTTVGYDWAKYRTTSVRRTSSVRKTAAQQPAQQQPTGYAGNPAIPPKPPARPSSGDDYEIFTRVDRSTATRSSSVFGSTASPSARTASTAGSTNGGAGGYRSIFGSQPSSTPAGGYAAANGHSSSATTGPPAGGGSVFSRSASTNLQSGAVNNVSAFSRSSSARSGSRTRYSCSSTLPRSASATPRSSSPTPAQQWHSMYCHSGDDFVATSGTSYAATTALVRASALGSQSGAGDAGFPWHRNVGGDGFAGTALPSAEHSLVPVSTPDMSANAWRSAAAMAAGDDYHVQHALVRVEQQSSLPVQAAPRWNQVASFISMGSN